MGMMGVVAVGWVPWVVEISTFDSVPDRAVLAAVQRDGQSMLPGVAAPAADTRACVVGG